MLFRDFLGDVDNPYFIEVILRGTLLDNQERAIPCLNVFHFRRLVNTENFSPVNICSAFETAFKTSLLAATNVRYTMDQIECRGMDDPAAATAINPVGEAGTIGNAASAYTAANAVYILLRTGFRGKSFKGSKHFGGLDEAHVTQDELNATGEGLWANVMDVLTGWVSPGLSDADGNAWKLCIISPTLSSLGPTDIPAIFTGADVATAVLNLTVGTMRHRKEKTIQA